MGAASAASFATNCPFAIVLTRLYTIRSAPIRYIPPPMLLVTYIGIILVTVSRNWNFSCPSGVKVFHIMLWVNPAQYNGTA